MEQQIESLQNVVRQLVYRCQRNNIVSDSLAEELLQELNIQPE